MAEEIKTERITILLSPSELKTIDDWSFSERIRSRGEAIRRLIELGLEAAKDRQKVKA
jgi:metal-responsive CopG/Arc/MetJ family transcriptional regulator